MAKKKPEVKGTVKDAVKPAKPAPKVERSPEQKATMDLLREAGIAQRRQKINKRYPDRSGEKAIDRSTMSKKDQARMGRLDARQGRIDARQAKRAGGPPSENAQSPATTPDSGGEAGYAPPPMPSGPDPARKALERYVQMAGFPLSMVDDLLQAQYDGLIDGDSQIEDYIAVGVDNKDFQARFPVIVDQWKKLQAGDLSVQLMTPNQVRDYETQVKNAADDYGLSSWVSDPQQIATLIGGDVDVTEAVDRINQAGYAASAAPPAFREAFLKRYGLTEGNLVGFFLDPDKEEGEIKKAIGQGQIVAAAIQNGFANNWGTGERLWERGFSGDQAMSGFARAALARNLGGGLGATITEDTMINSEFGDAAAVQQLQSATAQREGRFNTSGGAAESSKGVTGLGAGKAT